MTYFRTLYTVLNLLHNLPMQNNTFYKIPQRWIDKIKINIFHKLHRSFGCIKLS